MQRIGTFFIFLLLFVVVSYPLLAAQKLTLTVATLKDGNHRYYHELLRQSLTLVGYQLTINHIHDLSQKRIAIFLKQGVISVHWFIKATYRDQTFVPINIGITNGLIGKRVLLIPNSQQHIYQHVKTLADFRQLQKTGGFGEGWFDVLVWKYNQLPYRVISGDSQDIFLMVAARNRGIDYFSRGVNEILAESVLYPELSIEQQLLLRYDRDFQFYLSPTSRQLKPLIETALIKAKQTGLIDRLVNRYWQDTFKQLNLDQRVELKLKTPPS
ncbi:hypothetical protein H0A36_12790 [Endozoicomonas sp. SM1973]|uniref:Solute-binding protein family 3/N-terminal domain-containing protein n=1 Tax=Spartinivicinus marinus TaxID=2994442 RepID=A0A853HYS9_9GAMM|nr:hypothetical protein [Spartinivicinus marinus]MCX4026518.1 hypothetical protein [Spartinivicinus marinus]NYZ66890.1 hypothetical protein [Spartinivicinus marinus]